MSLLVFSFQCSGKKWAAMELGVKFSMAAGVAPVALCGVSGAGLASGGVCGLIRVDVTPPDPVRRFIARMQTPLSNIVMRNAVIVSQNGMGSGDAGLGLLLLRRYLRNDLEKDDRAERYVFYNGGVRAALLDEEIRGYLQELEKRGSLVLLCGTCIEHFGLTDRLNFGRNACLGDVRESMAMDRVNYL